MTGLIVSRPSSGERAGLPAIEVDGRPVSVSLRISARAKRLRLSVKASGVEVVLPRRARRSDAQRFVDQSVRWIEDRVRRIRKTSAGHPGAESLRDGASIPLRGEPVRLEVAEDEGRSSRVEHAGQSVRVVLPRRLAVSEDEGFIERILVRWLRTEALADARAIVAGRGGPHGLVPKVLRVKEQTTRWGSCSSNGAINLNWRLVMAPPEVFEYVVVHELGHLEHPHHQPAFWRRVAEIMPDYGRPRRWLRENGGRLSLRRPTTV